MSKSSAAGVDDLMSDNTPGVEPRVAEEPEVASSTGSQPDAHPGVKDSESPSEKHRAEEGGAGEETAGGGGEGKQGGAEEKPEGGEEEQEKGGGAPVGEQDKRGGQNEEVRAQLNEVGESEREVESRAGAVEGAEKQTRDDMDICEEVGSETNVSAHGGAPSGSASGIPSSSEPGDRVGEGDEAWKDPRNNRHCRQVYENGKLYSAKVADKIIRILPEDYEREKYRRRQGEVKTVIHWGQRKLLLSEIEFLTKFTLEEEEHRALYKRFVEGRPEEDDNRLLVVYAGAAPGTHIQMLAEMFPHCYFVLVDPAPFTVRNSINIETRQEMFTSEMAEEFKEMKPLFICDIRAADCSRMTDKETDEQVRKDMDDQMKWHEQMEARMSILKFRLSWMPGKTEYLDGDIYFPIWGPITTTEARLFTDGKTKKEYDNTKYEEQMFWFNTIARCTLYPHGVEGQGIDHCYDCTAEIHVLGEYLQHVREIMTHEHMREPYSKEQLNKDIADMSADISRRCARNRTLFDPNPDPEDRKRRINRRQFVNGMPAYEAHRRRDSGGHYDPWAQEHMKSQGWAEGQGLGRDNRGITAPVIPTDNPTRAGLGHNFKAMLASNMKKTHSHRDRRYAPRFESGGHQYDERPVHGSRHRYDDTGGYADRGRHGSRRGYGGRGGHGSRHGYGDRGRYADRGRHGSRHGYGDRGRHGREYDDTRPLDHSTRERRKETPYDALLDESMPTDEGQDRVTIGEKRNRESTSEGESSRKRQKRSEGE